MIPYQGLQEELIRAEGIIESFQYKRLLAHHILYACLRDAHPVGTLGKIHLLAMQERHEHILWEHVGMGRTKEGLEEGLKKMKALREEFNKNLFIPGKKEGLNVELDKAIHLRDFILMGELIAYDALHRNESCGGHFREEYQTEEGEAKRDDENFFYVGCWEYQGNDTTAPVLNKEPLEYEAIKVQTRNYKN